MTELAGTIARLAAAITGRWFAAAARALLEFAADRPLDLAAEELVAGMNRYELLAACHDIARAGAPPHVVALLEQAQTAAELGDIDTAADLWEQATGVDPWS